MPGSKSVPLGHRGDVEPQSPCLLGVPGRMNPLTTGVGSLLWVPDKNDVSILELPLGPSWWTAERVITLRGCTAIIAVSAAVWIVTLKPQVRRQTEE
jgi:hypothetical protein